MLKLCIVLTSCFLQLCSSLRRKVQKSPQVSQVRLIWVNCWQTSPLFHLFLLRYVTGILHCSTFTFYVNVNYVQSCIAASFRCCLITFILVFSLRSFDSNHSYIKLMYFHSFLESTQMIHPWRICWLPCRVSLRWVEIYYVWLFQAIQNQHF